MVENGRSFWLCMILSGRMRESQWFNQAQVAKYEEQC